MVLRRHPPLCIRPVAGSIGLTARQWQGCALGDHMVGWRNQLPSTGNPSVPFYANAILNPRLVYKSMNRPAPAKPQRPCKQLATRSAPSPPPLATPLWCRHLRPQQTSTLTPLCFEAGRVHSIDDQGQSERTCDDLTDRRMAGVGRRTNHNVAAAIKFAINIHLGKCRPLHMPQHCSFSVRLWGLCVKEPALRGMHASC